MKRSKKILLWIALLIITILVNILISWCAEVIWYNYRISPTGKEDEKLGKIQVAIGLYYDSNKELPKNLIQLKESWDGLKSSIPYTIGLDKEEIVKDIWGNEHMYVLMPDEFMHSKYRVKLSSCGPDGIPNTKDDRYPRYKSRFSK